MPFLDEADEQLAIDRVAGCLQHRVDVADVLLRLAFTVVLQLADDDVLDRRDRDSIAIQVESAAMLECPAMKLVEGDVDVSLEAGCMMDEVAVTPQATANLDRETAEAFARTVSRLRELVAVEK